MTTLDQFIRAIVLGLVEGITEFLPISSMAHMKVVPMLLGWGDPGLAVGAVIQLGSISAVIFYFRKDLAEVIRSVIKSWKDREWRNPVSKLGIAIVVGTIPVVIVGLIIKKFVPGFDHSLLRSLRSIGIVSIIMAVLLALAERIASHKRTLKDIQMKDGILVGCAQALAIIPGVSRSGSTLTASLFDNWKRDDAARFSFLLGIPAITLGGLAELKDAFSESSAYGAMPLLCGVVTAFISSLIVIHFLIQFLRQNTTFIFVIYRLAFGTFLLLAGSAIEHGN
jgi:undecaprenyl-diphosphatase